MTPVGFTPKRSSWTTTGSQKDCWMQTTAVRPAFFYHGGSISQTPQLCWMIWSAEWRLIGLLPSRNPENHGMWRTWNLVLVFIIVLFKSGLLLCTLFVCLMPQNSFSKQLLFDLLRPSYSEYVEDSTHAWIGFWHWFLRSLPLWRWWKSTNRCWSETHWTYVFFTILCLNHTAFPGSAHLRFELRHADSDILQMLETSVPPADVERVSIFLQPLKKYQSEDWWVIKKTCLYNFI